MYTLQVQNEEVDLSLGVEDLGIDSDLSGALRNPDNVTSWPTMSSDSFGKTHCCMNFIIQNCNKEKKSVNVINFS